jgi:hypothetical protein
MRRVFDHNGQVIPGDVVLLGDGYDLMRDTDQDRDPLQFTRRPTKDTKDTNPKDALGSTRAALFAVPLPALLAWTSAHVEGAIKYGWWNWTSAGVRASIYVAAAARHLFKWFFGQDKDPVTGVHHLGYVMACCAILIDAEWRAKLVDDRPPALPRMDELFAQTEAILKNLAATMKPQPGVRDYTNTEPEGVPRTP